MWGELTFALGCPRLPLPRSLEKVPLTPEIQCSIELNRAGRDHRIVLGVLQGQVIQINIRARVFFVESEESAQKKERREQKKKKEKEKKKKMKRRGYRIELQKPGNL